MALKTTLVDDITGDEGAETREFMFDGIHYKIDLVEKTMGEFREAIAGFIESATVVQDKRPRRVATVHKAPAEKALQNNAIREWAKRKGIAVKDRGRIPADIVDRFEAEFAEVSA
ncbi:Lsr2-like DNA bridging protein [Mycobacterium phage Nebkiss]|nr:Lsr2-like DNA bridging protein [Mycobacterium phage Nebkiss]